MNSIYIRLAGLLLCAGLIIVGCAQPSQDNPATPTAVQLLAANSGPRVYFVEPANGAEVTSPLQAKFAAQEFTVEPASPEIKSGHGHLHVMVDADCVPAGQGIPKDETHLHFGKGQMEAEIPLTPGEHKLCLQAGDGNHIALAGDGMSQVITITVH